MTHRPDPETTSLPPGLFEPGQFVLNPAQPEWGVGQVQSAIGTRVTITFEHAGKIMVNAAVVALVTAPDRADILT